MGAIYAHTTRDNIAPLCAFLCVFFGGSYQIDCCMVSLAHEYANDFFWVVIQVTGI